MKEKYEEIKLIISNLSDVSMVQLNKLIDVYGENIVKKVIKDIYNNVLNEDDDNTLEYDIDNEDVVSLDWVDKGDPKDALDYYFLDISNIINVSLSEKNNLINEIFNIVNELDKLFSIVDNFSDIYNARKKPWIVDKVQYCNWRCKDKELLKNINNLYNQYVVKRNILVESNLKFVITIAKTFYNVEYGLGFDELVQYGNMGIIRAVETYDPSYGADFLTYAGYWIKQSIIVNSKKNMCNYKVPLYFYEMNVKRIKVIDRLTNELGRVPTDLEIANYMEISIDKIRVMVDTFAPVLSLDEPIEIDGLDTTRVEQIRDESVDIERDINLSEMKIELYNYMCDVLNERDRFILRNRYGFDDLTKVEDIARELRVSSQRIYQLSDKALKKLTKAKGFENMQMYLR